jgi:hypothetical protein
MTYYKLRLSRVSLWFGKDHQSQWWRWSISDYDIVPEYQWRFYGEDNKISSRWWINRLEETSRLEVLLMCGCHVIE